jgi:pimeloyl-ACP methyl ester carboxylesterase
MGDRFHLLREGLTIETFVDDLVQVIESEELDAVTLVGHSFGGIPISGVVDRIPQRIARLVYLDTLVVESGQSAFSAYPQSKVDERIADAIRYHGGLAVSRPDPLPPAWGLVAGTPDHAWVKRRLTPHPLASYMSPLTLVHPLGNGRPCTYVHCRSPSHSVMEQSRVLARLQPGWDWCELNGPHEAHVTHPALCADLLLSLAACR